MGIDLPAVAAPVAAYIPAQRVGNGPHLGSASFRWRHTGVGEGRRIASADDAYGLARVAALNALAAAASVSGGIDAIKRIRHVTVFVASAVDFTGQPQVASGASELFAEIFGDSSAHTRSASRLPSFAARLAGGS